MNTVKGFSYPLVSNARGYFYTAQNVDVVKADLLQLLLTNPGERVMMPDYGTPLRRLLFEPADTILADTARNVISDSIRKWEPRIAVEDIQVGTNQEQNALNVTIEFRNFKNISQIEKLVLELPFGGNQ